MTKYATLTLKKAMPDPDKAKIHGYISGSASDNGTSPAWRAASEALPVACSSPIIIAFKSKASVSSDRCSCAFSNMPSCFFIISRGSTIASSRYGSRNSLRGRRAARYVNDLMKQSNSVSCCNLQCMTSHHQQTLGTIPLTVIWHDLLLTCCRLPRDLDDKSATSLWQARNFLTSSCQQLVRRKSS